MDLKTAIDMVVADSRDRVEALHGRYDLSPRAAIESARLSTHREIGSTIDDPELRDAYDRLIDASVAEINNALTAATL